MPNPPMRPLAVLVVAGSLLAGCFDLQASDERPGFTAREPVLRLGAGDVRIVSTDGQLELALVGERVLMRMSDSAVARIRRDLDVSTAAVGGGVGDWIEKSVKGTVQGVLDRQMVMPVALIRSATYEGGEIRIRMRGSDEPLFFPGAGGQASTTAKFPPGEAERFVAAVEKARGRRT
jgi:hypothetical protein